jgi:hypothetical protein
LAVGNGLEDIGVVTFVVEEVGRDSSRASSAGVEGRDDSKLEVESIESLMFLSINGALVGLR